MTGNDMTCPGCGLLVKISDNVLDKCPVCGAKLPVPGTSQKGKGKASKPKTVSLESLIFNRTGGESAWTIREVLNCLIWSYFVSVLARFFIIILVASPEEGSTTIPFDPVLVIAVYLSACLLGVIPVAYIKSNRMSWSKIGLNRVSRKDVLIVALVGVVAGVTIALVDTWTSSINAWVYQATGWDAFGPSPSQGDYVDFINASLVNRIVIAIPVALSLAFGEIVYRGVVARGFLDHFSRKREQAGMQSKWGKGMARLVAIIGSAAVNMLLD